MIQKNLENIVEADLQSLIDNEIIENKTLEYKESLPSNSEEDKKKFLASISSFANASGGDLILGIKENRATGAPLGSLIGLELTNIDQEKLRLEQIIRDGIEPKIPSSLYKIQPIRLLNSNYILIIRIAKSWLNPHRISYKAWHKFYSRSSSGKYLLDIQELRAAFILSETIIERIKVFRENRISNIMANETPLFVYKSAKIVLHLIPLSSFNVGQVYDLAKISPYNLVPMVSSGFNTRINIDGILSFAKLDSEPDAHSYVQFFRNSIIEAVDCYLLGPVSENYIPISEIETEIIEKVKLYIKNFQDLAIEPPIFIFLSLLGVKGYKAQKKILLLGSHYPIDRDVLLLPEIIIEDYDFDLPTAFKFCFDSIWNSCGILKSPNYNKEGSWVPKT